MSYSDKIVLVKRLSKGSEPNSVQRKEQCSLFYGKIKCVGSEQITFPPLLLKNSFRGLQRNALQKDIEILPTHIFSAGVFIDNYEISYNTQMILPTPCLITQEEQLGADQSVIQMINTEYS